jgi:predicted esterase
MSATPRPSDESAAVRTVPATVHGRYLALPPRQGGGRHWLVGFHGYAQGAEGFLEALRPIPGARDWLIASVQALHPFYAGRNEVVASWMTRQDRDHAIADNVAYVDAVLTELEREHGAPEALVFAGFSQGVGMAYRAALLGRRPAAAILAAGGDIPPELKSHDRTWPTVVICGGAGDALYTPQVLRAEIEFLASVGADVRTVTFDGGHEWSSEVVEAAGRLLSEVAARRG